MRRHLRTPLARYGFTLCAAVALLNELTLPFLFSAAISAYAWHVRR